MCYLYIGRIVLIIFQDNQNIKYLVSAFISFVNNLLLETLFLKKHV